MPDPRAPRAEPDHDLHRNDRLTTDRQDHHQAWIITGPNPGTGLARVDWSAAADAAVAILRTEAGRDPHDHDLKELVSELSTRSEEFWRRWGDHDVRHHATGMKAFRHPVVGETTLSFQAAEPVGETALTLTLYTAESSTTSDANLRLLASWAASAPAAAPVTEPAELDRASAAPEGRNP